MNANSLTVLLLFCGKILLREDLSVVSFVNLLIKCLINGRLRRKMACFILGCAEKA